jgi:hypothetical protein
VSIPLPSSLCVFVGPTSSIAHADHHGNYREGPGRTGLSRAERVSEKGLEAVRCGSRIVKELLCHVHPKPLRY